MGAREPHFVDRDQVESIGYVCGKCGAEVDGDGDGWWHRDATLEPADDAALIEERDSGTEAGQREDSPLDTLDLSGTERGDGYNREQQLARRMERWLDDLALAGSLSPEERRDIHLTVGQREDSPLDAEKEALAFIQEVAPLLTASMTDPKMVTALHRLMYRAEVLNVEPTDARESKP